MGNDALVQRIKDAVEAEKALSPEQRALNAARQRRSWVISEMMFGSDTQEASGKDAMTKEEARRRYDATDAGALLAGYERLLEAAPMVEAGKGGAEMTEVIYWLRVDACGLAKTDPREMTSWIAADLLTTLAAENDRLKARGEELLEIGQNAINEVFRLKAINADLVGALNRILSSTHFLTDADPIVRANAGVVIADIAKNALAKSSTESGT